jgi:hypothetical protein
MIKIIVKTRRHLFVFITNRALSATTNGSERAFRPCAAYRKITNGFRSAWAATLYANVRSAVETARRRNLRTIDAIRLTLSAQPIPHASPISAHTPTPQIRGVSNYPTRVKNAKRQITMGIFNSPLELAT